MINKFEKGEVVFHKSNTKQLMVVISTTCGVGGSPYPTAIKCRWITPKFKCKTGEFFEFELIHNEPPRKTSVT